MDNTTVKDFVDKNCTFAAARDLLLFKVMFYGIDPEQFSLLALFAWAYSIGGVNNLFKMEPPQLLGVSGGAGGMTGLCEKLANKIGKEENIKLSKKVLGIKKSDDGTVST